MGIRELKKYYKSLDRVDIQKSLEMKLTEILVGDIEDLDVLTKQYFALCQVARNKRDFGKVEIDKYMMKYSQAIDYLVGIEEKREI